MLIVALTTLVLPWAGCQYARELETALRSSQEQSLLAGAATIANALTAQPQRVFHDSGDARAFSAAAGDLYVYPLVTQPLLDGYREDWDIPAEPTPLIAARFIRLLHTAGVPPQAVHLVPTPGRLFGEIALAHPALAGVAMTGSTATALTINRAMAARGGIIVPLIAETGGLNAMIVDSTALPEQVVDDVVSSAFMSAGQRCSALRLLFLQEEIADAVLEMIAGAMDELIIGDPSNLQTDVGPVINAAARDGLAQHVAQMRKEARIVKACELGDTHAHGSFFAPHLIELKSAGQLTHEEFGPILHVVRYRSRDIQQVLEAIRDSHYGLTLGVQTRLESFWRQVFAATSIGNTYVNRNMIGAVVGVQPFGGNGLSGTGPKAGGPHYLTRFANERTLTVNTTATGGNAALLNLGN